MRYLAYTGGRFVAETLPYTTLRSRQEANLVLEPSPLEKYDLGDSFYEALSGYTQITDNVTELRSGLEPTLLFEANQLNDKIYVVGQGSVKIELTNGEVVQLERGELFGESSLRGEAATGRAALDQGSSVLQVDAKWFMRITQSRQQIQSDLLIEGRPLQPVQLLYHIAATTYDRVRRRLITQTQR